MTALILLNARLLPNICHSEHVPTGRFRRRVGWAGPEEGALYSLRSFVCVVLRRSLLLLCRNGYVRITVGRTHTIQLRLYIWRSSLILRAMADARVVDYSQGPSAGFCVSEWTFTFTSN